MKQTLGEVSELLKVAHATAEKDPMFTKMIISQVLNLIDCALFEQEMEHRIEQGLEQFIRDIEKMNFPF